MITSLGVSDPVDRLVWLLVNSLKLFEACREHCFWRRTEYLLVVPIFTGVISGNVKAISTLEALRSYVLLLLPYVIQRCHFAPVDPCLCSGWLFAIFLARR